MGRGRRKKQAKAIQAGEGATVVVDNEGTSTLELGCAVVSLRRFPAALKERVAILQARRRVAGVKDETLEMLHAHIAELGVIQCEQELDRFEAESRELAAQGQDERETNP